ncbi:MAG TPA: GNAT family N-acetyltransferase [Candidatus Aquilonibacter sp.]|nr:GNAT family N-acetyltransferase [Candidatus Aquilonibacter sp.]
MAFIETDRLLLRTWMPSDASRLHEIMSDPDVTRFLPDAPRTLQWAREWIERQMDEQEREGFSLWPVIRKADGRLIGRGGLHRLPDGLVEAGWIFERAAWGHGFATEAARAAIDYGLHVAHLSRVYALVAPGNAASIGVAYRVGMRFDRVVRAYKRDLLRYVR